MTRTEVFSLLLVTAVLAITGTKEVSQGHIAIGGLMLAIPVCGWISVWFAR